MQITRSGAERHRGTTIVVPHLSFNTSSKDFWENNLTWSPRAKQLDIRAPWVLHTDGITHHNYTVTLTLEDISSLIGLLGHAGSATDARLLRDHLAKHVPAIVKLLACATGVAPVFRAITLDSDHVQGDIQMSIVFAQTYHQIQNQEYTLDVAMSIEGGKKPFLKQYRVSSNEKATLWERLNTNAYEGKVLAVRRLLERLVPDIQAYVAENA
jgi:hypothetical protein